MPFFVLFHYGVVCSVEQTTWIVFPLFFTVRNCSQWMSYRERSSSWILWFISTLKNIMFSLNLIDWFLFSFDFEFSLIYQFIYRNTKKVAEVENAQLILRMLHFLIFILVKIKEAALKRLHRWWNICFHNIMYLEVANRLLSSFLFYNYDMLL